MADVPSAGRIDFADLSASLLERAETLVPQWLPGGRKQGYNWMCGGFEGGPGRSLGVNLATGAWGEFAADEKGGDLISLYAAIHGLPQGQAARQIMHEMGWAPRSAVAQPPRAAPRPSAEQPVADEIPAPAAGPGDGGGGKRRSIWRAVVPVPSFAPAPDFKHWERSAQDLEGTWEYRVDGKLYGYVVRFRTSDGGKEILPHTWCVDESDGRGTQRWHWKQWDEPRPLYVPAGQLSGDLARPVVVVEGEKCAMAGHELLGQEFDFVAWPGGCKAWSKASWDWLAGSTVYLWPDCDAKRQRLTREERDTGVEPISRPLLPEQRQPGMAAMVGIGSLLAAVHGCAVSICQIPQPGAVGDGWDIADAIAQGWDAARVRDFIRGAVPFVPADAAPQAEHGISTPSAAGAGPATPAAAWRDKLLTSAKGAPLAVRDNLVLALDGIGLGERGWLPGVPEAQGLVGFNEFTNDVVKLKPAPWGTPAGVWDEVDELEMGAWLTREHWLPSMPRGTLEEAVAMVAKRHRFHPVRDEFAALRGTWDGEKRLSTWLRRCCLEEDEWDDAAPLQQYLARVGTWVPMAICARVMHPGCKFDYMPILEGPQGIGKSTLAKVLGGDYFADTGLVLGDKDSYQNLQGVLVYEWGELDSLNRSEVTKVKQFISSPKDRFRASFDRRAKDYPRQVVFIGTTNEDHYLVDPTGNRRMWPIRVTRQIDIDWVREHRAQLYAEALVYLDAGQRFHPNARETRELFESQQQQRQLDNAIQVASLRYLYDENQRMTSTGGENGTLVSEITVQDLLTRLGISVDKQTHVIVRQATSALRHAGWEQFRSTRGDRPRMFRRPQPGAAPSGSSCLPGPTQDQHDEGRHGCPF